jgi:hypothetical protein
MMKTKYSFAVYDPRGRTMVLAEGDTVPIGWFIKDWDSEVPIEVTEVTTVVGTTKDISNPYDGGSEKFVRFLTVRTASETAAIAAAAAADIVGQAEAARLNEIITDAGITGREVKWAKYYPTDAVGLRMGRDLVTEASVRSNLSYWLSRQTEAVAKAAAAAVAKAEALLWSGMPDVVGIVRAEFRRCGWHAQEQTQLVLGGYDETQVCDTGEMYLYRVDSEQEGYSLRDQGSSYFHCTGYRRTETVTAIHPRYGAAIDAAEDAWFYKTAITPDQLLAVIRLSMGDIVLPTVEETRAKEAAELAQQKADNAARRQARRDEEAAEFAAKKALKLSYRGPQRDTTQAPAEAPALISPSVNLNDPWGSLSALKL